MTRALRTPTTVLVADDDAQVLQAVAALLADEDDLLVVGRAPDGQTALELAIQHRPAVAIVDVAMPHGGPGLVRALRSLEHRPEVIALSADAHVATWTRMLAAGASGYLLKGAVAGDLASLVRRCVHGELVVTVPGAAEAVRRMIVGRDQST